MNRETGRVVCRVGTVDDVAARGHIGAPALGGRRVAVQRTAHQIASGGDHAPLRSGGVTSLLSPARQAVLADRSGDGGEAVVIGLQGVL